MRELFNLFDRDGNGKISRNELKLTMASCVGLLDDSEIDAMLAEADTDGDGKIDPDEFWVILNKQRD